MSDTVPVCKTCDKPKTVRRQRDRSGEAVTRFVCDPCRSANIRQTRAQRRQAASEVLPPPPAALPALPWATPDVCAAVRQALATPAVRKQGQFAIVRHQGSCLIHVPPARLRFPAEAIVLVARLGARGKWALRAPTGRELSALGQFSYLDPLSREKNARERRAP